MPHPNWQEPPLLIVVRKSGQTATAQEILAFLNGRVAKWWLPANVVFVDALPHTATGKLQKQALRHEFAGYVASV